MQEILDYYQAQFDYYNEQCKDSSKTVEERAESLQKMIRYQGLKDEAKVY